MKAKLQLLTVTALGTLLGTGVAFAQNQGHMQLAMQSPGRSSMQQFMPKHDIYGYKLMSPEQINAYRARMRAAKTPQERQGIRAAHAEEMQARARQRGLPIPTGSSTSAPAMNHGPEPLNRASG